MARAAKLIVEENHLDHAISIVNKSSKDVICPSTDLPEKADVFVAEIFGDDPLNEGVIATLEHAWENLLIPEALIIPAEVVVYASIVQSHDLARQCKAPTNAGGLNFSTLDNLCKFRQYNRLKSYQCDTITEPTEVLRVQLAEQFRTQGTKYTSVETVAGGEAQFVIFWYDLVMPGGDVYSTSGEEEMYRGKHAPWTRAWNQVSYGLWHTPEGVLKVAPGDKLEIKAEFRYDRLWFNVEFEDYDD